MLVIHRHPGQQITIFLDGEQIGTVTNLGANRIGFDVPPARLKILRAELTDPTHTQTKPTNQNTAGGRPNDRTT